jgi:uncharacterized protein DUF2510
VEPLQLKPLNEQPPPSKRATPGYYADPLGSRRARYWDGSNWTPKIGPRLESDAPPDQPVPPPTRVCRHCAVQAETFEASCPNCGRSYGRLGGAALAAIVAACVAAVLFLGGCAALIAVLAGIKTKNGHAISKQQFDSLQLGSSEDAVRQRLGTPREQEAYERRGAAVDCLYYNEQGRSRFSQPYFQLCFAGGRLYVKRSGY